MINEMAVKGSNMINAKESQDALNRMCKVIVVEGSGTGFYCIYKGKTFVMTNHHVIERKEEVKLLKFNYFDDVSEEGRKVDVNKDFFFNMEELDFAIIGVDDRELDRLRIRPLDLSKLGSTNKGEFLTCYQHPEGRPLATANGNLSDINEDFIWHTCSTEKGSSGGIIYDRNLKPIALHHQRDPHRKCNRAVLLKSILMMIDFFVSGSYLSKPLPHVSSPLPRFSKPSKWDLDYDKDDVDIPFNKLKISGKKKAKEEEEEEEDVPLADLKKKKVTGKGDDKTKGEKKKWPAKTLKGEDCSKCLKLGEGSFCHHHIDK